MSRILELQKTHIKEDDILIEQIILGSIDAENSLYKKYFYKLVDKISGGMSIYDTEDIVQDTMIIAITNIKNGKYVHKQTLFSYISGISWILRKKFHKNLKYHSPINDAENIVEINFHTDSIEIIKQERISAIVKAMKYLDPLCKKLLTYSFFDELKPRHIVGLMNEFDTPVQVTKRKYKCLEKLKRKVIKLI